MGKVESSMCFFCFFDAPKMGIEGILFPQKCQVFSHRIEEDLRRLRDNDGH